MIVTHISEGQNGEAFLTMLDPWLIVEAPEGTGMDDTEKAIFQKFMAYVPDPWSTAYHKNQHFAGSVKKFTILLEYRGAAIGVILFQEDKISIYSDTHIYPFLFSDPDCFTRFREKLEWLGEIRNMDLGI